MSKYGNLFDGNGMVKVAPKQSGPPIKPKHPLQTKLDREREICIGCTKEKCNGSDKCVAKRMALVELEKEKK